MEGVPHVDLIFVLYSFCWSYLQILYVLFNPLHSLL